MKGYNNDNGYMGMINGEYMLFATENEYFDYISDADCDWGDAA